MKIGIIAANSIRYSPYIDFYTAALDKMGCHYEVIYPERNAIHDKTAYTSIELPWNSIRPKVFGRIAYYSKVKQYCKESDFDFLIVLTTSSAVMLSGWLSRRYRNRYIVDVRDYTHEDLLPYYWLEKNALNHSAMNVVSSMKFSEFLPDGQYRVSNNISVDKTVVPQAWRKKTSQPIVIGYVGSIAYEAQCKSLIDLVAADNRFELHFYGTGQSEQGLMSYVHDHGFNGIVFHGGYLPADKSLIIQSVDILFNAYGNHNSLLRYALSNKLYDAMYYHRPILTSPNTFMSELAGIAGWSIDFDNDSSLNGLFDWYQSLNETVVNEYMDKMMRVFEDENNETAAAVIDCINKCDC